MSNDGEGSYAAARRRKLVAGLAATPAQRLAWLEEVMRLAFASGALPRPPRPPESVEARAERLRIGVCDVLGKDWDPIGVSDEPDAFGEYDSYASTVCSHLLSGVDEDGLSALLENIERQAMGLDARPDERRRRVARRLLALLRA